MNKFIWAVLLVVFMQVDVFASTVDTLAVRSNVLNKDVELLLIRPDNYKEGEISVVFLLHGYDGNHLQWGKTKPNLPELSDKLNFVFICPNAHNSWYWDSPLDAESQYESFFIEEFIPFLKNEQHVSLVRERTAITGLSMGGHGALWYAHRYPTIFGAVGSMSGGLDLREFSGRWNLRKHLGNIEEWGKRWDEFTVASHVEAFEKANLAIIFDCGVDDFFYSVNLKMHKELLAKKVSHDFISRPGVHNHAYWNNALDYQLLFFWKFFNRAK